MEDERGPGLDFTLCFVCGSRPRGAAAFLLCLVILLLKCLNVRRFPPPSSRIYEQRYTHKPCCLKSSVQFSQSVMIWAAMSSAGVDPLCFLKSTVNTAIYQEILEHFMLPSADKLYRDADFIFQQDFTLAHTAKGTKSWFNDHGVTVLDWPANLPDLNPIENLWGIIKKKTRDTRSNIADDLKATIQATWACVTPEQCHRLIASMPRRIDAVIHAKGGRTKY